MHACDLCGFVLLLLQLCSLALYPWTYQWHQGLSFILCPAVGLIYHFIFHNESVHT